MYKEKHFYVIEENMKNTKMFELNTFVSKDKYIIFNQNSLKNSLSKQSYNKLLKNGLFMNKKKRTYNSIIGLQRLVGCLYSDITGLEMHHINKNKLDNSFSNLVPLDSATNKSIDGLPFKEMFIFGQEKQKEWLAEINKNKRNTLSNNPLLIIEILSKSSNKTSLQLQKEFKNKIKSIKIIRRILNTFFYKEEFLKYLKNNKIDIYGN